MSTILEILRSSNNQSAQASTLSISHQQRQRDLKRPRANFLGLGPSLHDVVEVMKHHELQSNYNVRPTMEYYGIAEEYIAYVEKYRQHLRKYMDVLTLNIQKNARYDNMFHDMTEQPQRKKQRLTIN